MKIRRLLNLLLLAVLCFAFLLPISTKAVTIPDYDFRNPVLISGTNLLVGAKYRFSNVKTGVDAIVTVVAFSGGITLNQMDGPTGYPEAFQPVIFAPANSKGYVEFKVDFVITGTPTALVMAQIISTSLDVDGTLAGIGNVYEYDMVKLNSGTSTYNFDMTSTELSMNSSGGWVTGTNVTGNNYSGVDTTAKNVMFTVMNYNSSSFSLRVGTDNQSTAGTTRNKSVYFANFYYNNSLLSQNALHSFAAMKMDNNVKLNWQLAKNNNVTKIIVERSTASSGFMSIYQSDVLKTDNYARTYEDAGVFGNNTCYRLKLISENGTIAYSKTILITSCMSNNTNINIFPSVMESTATLQIKSSLSANGTITIHDYSGTVISSQKINIQNGTNIIPLSNINNLSKGHYVAVVHLNSENFIQKLIKN